VILALKNDGKGREEKVRESIHDRVVYGQPCNNGTEQEHLDGTTDGSFEHSAGWELTLAFGIQIRIARGFSELFGFAFKYNRGICLWVYDGAK
jgi:hypothetical protein